MNSTATISRAPAPATPLYAIRQSIIDPRTARPYTSAAFAKLLGVSNTHYSCVECGAEPLSDLMRRRIAAHTGIRIAGAVPERRTATITDVLANERLLMKFIGSSDILKLESARRWLVVCRNEWRRFAKK